MFLVTKGYYLGTLYSVWLVHILKSSLMPLIN